MMNRIGHLLAPRFYFLLFALSFSSCQLDHGLAPIRTKITGHIIFDGPPPPAYVAEVRVVATRRFPPENLTSDVIFSDKINFSRSAENGRPDSVKYELIAESGVYSAVGVLWRRSGEAWAMTNILGIYTDPFEFAPREVRIDEEHPVVDSVNIFANWELAFRDAYIEGDIRFQGEWPEDTEIIALGMFPIVPKSPLEFLTLKALDITIPLFGHEPYHFRTPVASGNYKFIAVFWKGKGGTVFDIKAIGFYACPDDSTLPNELTVASGETVTGINMTADFASLPGGVRYRKDGGQCPQ